MDYEKKYKEALERAKVLCDVADTFTIYDINTIFPELKESENERIRKELIEQLAYITPNNDELDDELNTLPTYQKRIDKYRAWLEKQGEQKFSNIPSRETILAIWELGNDWKDLTKGVCSTEHGSQLKYIQNHWQESSYYDNIMEGGGRK